MTGINRNLVGLRNVDKVFKRGSEEIHVLGGLDLEIPEGEFLALMGPSGSGKSTLLNLIGGLDRHIGLVFQFYNLMPVLTAQKNVELPLLLTHLSAPERRKRAAIALDIVGLADRNNHFPRTLSGGEQQRVGIARAIVTDPTLLLCDEPTGDLDRKSSDGVLDLLQALNREQGKTIVMVTHDIHAAARASRTLYLNKGRLSDEAEE